MDAARAERWMKKEMNALRKLRRDEAYLAENHAKVESYAAGQGTVGAATTGLLVLAGYAATTGCLRVLDGDDDGWRRIDESCLYLSWRMRLLACAYDADERPQKQARGTLEHVANVWMHAEALGASEVRSYWDGRLRNIDAGQESLVGKDMNALIALAGHFATGKEASEIERSGWAELGPYVAVASGKLRAQDYDELADYHTRQVTDHGFPAFDRYPYRLIPFELFAIEKRTGVPIRSARHPLLNSPFAVRREVDRIPVPDQLENVIDRARTELPIDGS
jgi:hypothetical protein